MTAPAIALVSARAARALDDDLVPLHDALVARGARVSIVDWDDVDADWTRFDLAVLRSPWDYSDRLDEFLAWAGRAAVATRLLNPIEVVRWNTDKHYLGDLDRAGVAIVPSAFVEPGADAAIALREFLERFDDLDEFVVKPAVGAGSRDAQRHARDGLIDATQHIRRLLAAKRSVLLQPYLARVDESGETALIHFDGEFSHAIRKGPLLRRGEAPTRSLFADEHIIAREPGDDELELATRALGAIPFTDPLAYARVDLIRDGAGNPVVLELELTEPSFFFAHAQGAAERFALSLVMRAITAAKFAHHG